MASVSVIMPVYNRAHLIGETLQALLEQLRPADEIIVIDDGSTDGSADAARAFGDAVKVLEMPNGGPAAARNQGLTVAQGDFIQFMDSDDLPTPQFLNARLEAISRAEADISYGPWMPAWIDGKTVSTDGLVRQTAGVLLPLDAFLRGWVLFIPNAMIRRTLLEDAGGYPEGLFTGEDMLLLFRMLRRTDRLTHTDRSVLLVRQHLEGQISASSVLADRRIADELVLTETIALELQDGSRFPVVPSRSAIAGWNRRRARALAAVRSAGLAFPAEAGPPPGPLRALAAEAERLQARTAARLRYHRLGHRLAPHYHAAPIGPAHLTEIEALGLDWRWPTARGEK